MNIVDNLEQGFAPSLHDQKHIAALKYVPDRLDKSVESVCEGSLQPLHIRLQIWFCCLER